MWDVIVLGKIPGTGVYVTFVTWLYAVGVLAAVVMLLCMLRTLRLLFVSWRIARILGQEVKTGTGSLKFAHSDSL